MKRLILFVSLLMLAAASANACPPVALSIDASAVLVSPQVVVAPHVVTSSLATSSLAIQAVLVQEHVVQNHCATVAIAASHDRRLRVRDVLGRRLLGRTSLRVRTRCAGF